MTRMELGWTVTARWSGRAETPEAVADRLSQLLRGIAHMHPSFCTRRASVGVRTRAADHLRLFAQARAAPGHAG
jgi:hypothetical protein